MARDCRPPRHLEPPMATHPFTISLPIADRQTSFAFYREALQLEPIGEPADDGVPEPLQFKLGDEVRLMLVPNGGFGWVIGERSTAPAGASECLMSITVDTDDDVDETLRRADDAGATIVGAPESKPWGYVGTFADPDDHL